MRRGVGGWAIPGIAVLTLVLEAYFAAAADWYVAPAGKAEAQGTKDSPWDLESALGGRQKVAPGDTVWIFAGAYRHPNRQLGSPGYVVRLAGAEGKPIHVRAMPRQRVTLDGGLTVQQPATWLWIHDLELLVSENSTMSRTLNEPGSHPASYARPWGGLHVQSGKGCKYIHLVIHDNAQGISFWSGATDSEIYGCVIYDNGWKAPDRGHGHAIYTQNKDGVKTIDNCIMTGGYSYTMHAYGSKNAYVDNYVAQHNICYDAGPFLMGGGRPSHNLRVVGNCLYNVRMQLGYSAPSNQDCVVRDNVIVGGLQIKDFREAVQENNLVVAPAGPRPAEPARIVFRPSPYDPARAHLAIFNWAKKPEVELGSAVLGSFAKAGDTVRLLKPCDFYGKPVVTATYDGRGLGVPVRGEFAAFVVLAESGK